MASGIFKVAVEWHGIHYVGMLHNAHTLKRSDIN